MRRLTSINATICLALVVTGCTPPAQPNPATPMLPGTSWTVQAIAGNDIQSDIAVTMLFDKEGRVAGSSGCNRYFSTYQIDQNKLTFGPVAGTKMMCGPAPMKIERNFLSQLHNAETFSVSNTGKLVITAHNGEMIKAIRSPSPSAE